MGSLSPVSSRFYPAATQQFGAVNFGGGGKAMSRRDLERVLADHDFVELDGRSNKHKIFRGPHAQTGRDVNVSVSHGPSSKEIPPGTLRQIARDMGLTLKDLLGH